ncbi:hypothetical protein DFH07DRAFT_958725 [Mycena maculata]|uniref:Uncharacterized protein n=1 Tax=Mycena maculata TaxID=230809 RepID=A0AAD7J6G9_9AGAR|nr:hypothetical protein DFH07DRAFT_958725 [Mycena maculata]
MPYRETSSQKCHLNSSYFYPRLYLPPRQLEGRITPDLAQEMLVWVAPSKPHIVAKLARNTETALLLLQAGADPTVSRGEDQCQAPHVGVKLLFDHCTPIDDHFECDGRSQSTLHYACSLGDLEIMKLLASRGANLESIGQYGVSLGLVHGFKIDAVKFLLYKGANTAKTVPLSISSGGEPHPHAASLLYITRRDGRVAHVGAESRSRRESESGRGTQRRCVRRVTLWCMAFTLYI